MGEETIIAWTDHTFNPWMGCQRVSPGCVHCYAERLVEDRMGREAWGPSAPRIVTSEATWGKPRAWDRAARREGHSARVFVASLADVLEDRPELVGPRVRLWDLVRRLDALDWLILTKRPENYGRMLPPDWGAGWDHVWLGTSIESADYASRADHLRAVPAAVRFLSYEPALGPLALDLAGIHWVIYGGESGPGYRPHDLAWPRAMRAACAEAGAAFFFKQSPGIRTEMGIELDGAIVRAWPRERRILAGQPMLF